MTCKLISTELHYKITSFLLVVFVILRQGLRRLQDSLDPTQFKQDLTLNSRVIENSALFLVQIEIEQSYFKVSGKTDTHLTSLGYIQASNQQEDSNNQEGDEKGMCYH